MSGRVIAIIDWGSSAQLKENVRFFQRASDGDRVLPREWRDDAAHFRSLTLWEDGTCELQRFSTVAVARRLAGTIARTTARKVRLVERG